jgi:hypothetical protein
MTRQQSYWRGFAFFLPMLAAVLLWRAGYMPGWVYEGPLRDEVKRRTGFDLADRGSMDAPQVELIGTEPVPGPTPALVAEFENVGDRPVTEYRVVAGFRTPRVEKEGPRSAVTYLAGGGQAPLQPGERRRLRLESSRPYDPRRLGGGPASIVADLYWGGSFNYDGTRAQSRRDPPNELESFLRWEAAQPDVSGIVIRP